MGLRRFSHSARVESVVPQALGMPFRNHRFWQRVHMKLTLNLSYFPAVTSLVLPHVCLTCKGKEDNTSSFVPEYTLPDTIQFQT